MSAERENLKPEERIHLSEGQTEMLRKALRDAPQPAKTATLSETQFIKRKLEGIPPLAINALKPRSL